jgi:hypothetical protein
VPPPIKAHVIVFKLFGIIPRYLSHELRDSFKL